MTFPNESFDHVICVEAAFHFDTRMSFLRHALRILKPGGTVALTDVLLHERGHELLPTWLPANYLPTIDAYEHMLREVGFSSIELTDITEQGVHGYLHHMFAQVHEDWLSGTCDYRGLQTALGILHRVAATHRFNIMSVAYKI
jgi:ubiquinone/menaquinone biosynthesis C-methylase UbiE